MVINHQVCNHCMYTGVAYGQSVEQRQKNATGYQDPYEKDTQSGGVNS